MPKRLWTQLLGTGNKEEWQENARIPRILHQAGIPVNIGSSLWIAQGPSYSLVEFLPDSNTFAPDVEYPNELKNIQLSLLDSNSGTISCKYQRYSIVIIFVCRSDHFGVVFDTETREFGKVFRWETKKEPGGWLSCITIGNYLHIETFTTNGIVPVIIPSIPWTTKQHGKSTLELKTWRCHQQLSNPVISTNQTTYWSLDSHEVIVQGTFPWWLLLGSLPNCITKRSSSN